jgi:hypothetical protein
VDSIADGVIGIFHLHTLPFRAHYDPVVDSASSRNEYQEYLLGGKGGRCGGLTTLPLLYADCLQIWTSTYRKLQGLSRPVMGFLCLALPMYYLGYIQC